MHKEKTQGNVYGACSEEGSFLPLAKIDKDQISAMVSLALVDFETVKQWEKQASKNSGQWNAIYKIAYDVLHSLAEAFLRFDRMKAKTHECVFAYLCEKHPEFEFDWGFFEKIRTKRNRSVYYGEPTSYENWQEIKLQIILYISTLQKAIGERMK